MLAGGGRSGPPFHHGDCSRHTDPAFRRGSRSSRTALLEGVRIHRPDVARRVPMMTHDGSVYRAAHRLTAGGEEARDEVVAEEVAVALVYNGISHAVMMATPCDLEDLGRGFSLT